MPLDFDALFDAVTIVDRIAARGLIPEGDILSAQDREAHAHQPAFLKALEAVSELGAMQRALDEPVAALHTQFRIADVADAPDASQVLRERRASLQDEYMKRRPAALRLLRGGR